MIMQYMGLLSKRLKTLSLTRKQEPQAQETYGVIRLELQIRTSQKMYAAPINERIKKN